MEYINYPLNKKTSNLDLTGFPQIHWTMFLSYFGKHLKLVQTQFLKLCAKNNSVVRKEPMNYYADECMKFISAKHWRLWHKKRRHEGLSLKCLDLLFEITISVSKNIRVLCWNELNAKQMGKETSYSNIFESILSV